MFPVSFHTHFDSFPIPHPAINWFVHVVESQLARGKELQSRRGGMSTDLPALGCDVGFASRQFHRRPGPGKVRPWVSLSTYDTSLSKQISRGRVFCLMTTWGVPVSMHVPNFRNFLRPLPEMAMYELNHHLRQKLTCALTKSWTNLNFRPGLNNWYSVYQQSWTNSNFRPS